LLVSHGQAAFLNELADHSHVKYFQGLKQYREQGFLKYQLQLVRDILKQET